ncbi:MAG: aldo/keto reductase [Bacteroidales bacterium]|jgi:aryl-alcohol dehydrogenase-like predicted oxidoreductase|nr:aldo/keto reductase [Bacteroidales bacterium]
MKTVKLGESDISVSKITVGCWSFGNGEYWGKQLQKDVDETVRLALDMGVNTFDTAEAYNEGESECALGKALNGRRHEAVIISKINPSNGKNVREHCVKSLRRLGTDYLDVYMLHWPINQLSLQHFTADSSIIDAPPTIGEAYDRMNELKKEGLLRSIGVSNFGCTQMTEVRETGIHPDVNEITYNIISRGIEAEIAPYCMEHNISIIGSMGLQQGLLTGKYAHPGDVPKHQAHSRHFADFRGRETSRHGEDGAEKEVFEAIDELRQISGQMGVSMSQLAIAWILQKPFITSAIVGVRNVNQLKVNIEACLLTVPRKIELLIDKISRPVLHKLGNNPDYYEHSSKSRIF